MSRAKHHRARQADSTAGGHPNPPLAFVGVSLLVTLMAAVLIWHGTIASATSSSQTGKNNARNIWCGSAGQPACPTVDPGWVPLRSEAPGDVLAVLTHNKMFLTVESRYGQVGSDLPVLVHPFNPQNLGSDYYRDDHWILPVRDAQGLECGLLDFVYDRAHQAIRPSSFIMLQKRDPRYGRAFPYVSSSGAQAALNNARHMGLLSATAPELSFFPLAADYWGPEATRHWTGGGASPMDPMWLLQGADGHTYFVGSDLHVQTQNNLPLATA